MWLRALLFRTAPGTFGRVVECLDLRFRGRSGSHRYSTRDSSRRVDVDDRDRLVAIKVVRNIKRYCDSAMIEADIIEDVNRRGGRGLSHCVVLHDSFSYRGHYCMVFESLGPSLYDYLKRHNYRPFPMYCIRDFAFQLLETLEFLHGFGLIHTDLKLENWCVVDDRETVYEDRPVPHSTKIKVRTLFCFFCTLFGACRSSWLVEHSINFLLSSLPKQSCAAH